MDTLLVSQVTPFSPDSESAAVRLRSEHGEIVVFSYPCEVAVGDIVPNLLSCILKEAQAAYLTDWPDAEQQVRSAERLEKIGPFAYRGCGRVVDQQEGIIEVLGFRIEFGDVPCDGPIEFECERIDL